MNRSLKPLLLAALSPVGMGLGQSIADERDNIWWDVVTDYNRNYEKTCVAQNRNHFTVRATFELVPTHFDFEGNPLPGERRLTMRPHVIYKLRRWGGAYDPSCSLRSYTVR
jgi:hypothetical protein